MPNWRSSIRSGKQSRGLRRQFDPSGFASDIGQNAYFNATIAGRAGVSAGLTCAGAVGRVPGQHLHHVGHGAELHRGAAKGDPTPILVLDGAKEEAIELNQTKLVALLIPRATLDLMPDTGHFALFEQPEEFSRIVMDFLRSED